MLSRIVARFQFPAIAGMMLAVCLLSLTAGRQIACAGEGETPLGDESFKIVSPQWLAQHAADPDLRILDARADVHAYLAGHVPGAVHLADSTLRAPKDGVPVQYLEPDAMADLFRRANIGNQDRVVLYSDGDDVLGATMAAYCLHRLGHKKVMVLDGGYQVYAKSQKTAQDYPALPRGNLAPQVDRSIYATFDDVREAMKNPDVVLIDARPANAYAGNVNTWMRNGHIPGAVNVDWHQLVQTDNRHKFKPVEEMRQVIEQSGAKKDSQAIVYCGTSREATLLYMVMKHVLGYPNVRLYEGSWTEYCAHKDCPVAQGMERGRTTNN